MRERGKQRKLLRPRIRGNFLRETGKGLGKERLQRTTQVTKLVPDTNGTAVWPAGIYVTLL